MAIITRAADAGELAHSINIKFALREISHHFFDDLEDSVSPGALLRR